MGNDGGDIPKRKQLVKQKQKIQRPTMQSIAMGRYLQIIILIKYNRSRFCNLTKQKFKQPLVIDKLGCIYNFQNILQALVEKNLPNKYAYIKKMSDIKKVEIERCSTESPNFFLCPITKLQYNGFNKFVGIWTCGHLLSRKAFKQIKDQEDKCIVCGVPYQEKDIIDLNLEGQKFEVLRKAFIEKKNKSKNETGEKNGEDQMGNPAKKAKKDVYINSIDRLSGEFRDVIRDRKNFKELFKKDDGLEWQQNTFTAKK